MKPEGTGLLLVALLICLGAFQIPLVSNNQESVQKTSSIASSSVTTSLDYYTIHSRIVIDSNQDFEDLSLSGTGLQDDPYVIERLYVVTIGSQNSSISVSYTSVHFIIRDSYLITDWVGVEIRHVAEGTARIANNTCKSESGDGAGIVVWGTQNCTIVGNRCSNLSQGIHLNEAGRCYISSNNITENNYQGINIRYSHFNTITGNTIVNSSQHGLALVGTSSHNVIHHNQFVNNGEEETYLIDGERMGELTSQGFDEGSNNTWYDSATEEGNWWSDYSGSGSYIMDGPSNAVDQYPNAGENQLQTAGLDLLQIAVVVSFAGGFLILLAWLFLRFRNVKT